jgi:hypothetical protein
MKIYIPTRARILKQITRQRFFLDKIPYQVVYVVPESERDRYLATWPESFTLTVPDEYRLSDIR